MHANPTKVPRETDRQNSRITTMVPKGARSRSTDRCRRLGGQRPSGVAWTEGKSRDEEQR